MYTSVPAAVRVKCEMFSFTSFGGQGTFIYKVETTAQKKMFQGADYVFMADMWNPNRLSDSRHLWIPISWEDGMPILKKQ